MSSSPKTLLLYWKFIQKYPGHLIGIAIVVPMTLLLQTFLPATISADIITQISTGQFVSRNIWETFGPELVVFSISVTLGTVLGPRLMMMLTWGLEKRVQQDMAQYIFDYLLSQSADFHANSFGGALVSQANKFMSAYKQIADTTVGQLSILLFTIIFIAIFLCTKAPWFVVILVVLTALYITSTILAARFIRHFHVQQAQAQNRQSGQFADSITNILAVKSFAGEKFEARSFAKAIAYTRKCSTDLMGVVIKRDIYFSSITTAIRIVSLVLAIMSVFIWHAEIGTAFLVLTYTNVLAVQLWTFSGSTARTYNGAFGDARDMACTLQLVPDIEDSVQPIKLKTVRGKIAFRRVHFAHKDAGKKGPLFHNFNLNIAAGERIGLVGHSGSGKTTLTKLLLRFADINSGNIEIDDQNITKVPQQDLRRHIAYVPQEPLLFHRTVAENIAYGKPGATIQEIKSAARKAYAAEFIAKLPNGYDTLVGERGVKLSGGQRQRIAIARAILKDAPILILDEATSALDSESERYIQQSLEELMQGRTTIVIAHRLSTVQRMDRIVVLEKGKIVEEGSHTALLTLKGVYADLWTHQSGGFLES